MLLDKIINKLVMQYGTTDPFRIAIELGVEIMFEDLGSLYGYYNAPYRHKMIHINQNMSENTQKFTCAHELGHAVLHNKINKCFLSKNTLLNHNKYENQADKFAVRLILMSERVDDYMNHAICDFADGFTQTFGVEDDIAKKFAKYYTEDKKKADLSLVNTLGHEKLVELGLLQMCDYVLKIKDECQFQAL